LKTFIVTPTDCYDDYMYNAIRLQKY